MIKETFEPILDLPVCRGIMMAGGEIYFVGGCVRDMFMGNTPKDIDIIVRLLPHNQLLQVLEQYGKVDLVGESFGVIKYKDADIELDIALPRVDTIDPSKKGHKAIDAQSDHRILLTQDLLRRDFTINAIAINQYLQVIDPYNGVDDIENKKIRCVDEYAFVDDPLRIMRALQFAVRFEFDIAERTAELMWEYQDSLKDISGERKLMELEKMFKAPRKLHVLQSVGLFDFLDSVMGFYVTDVKDQDVYYTLEHFLGCINMPNENTINALVENLKLSTKNVNYVRGYQYLTHSDIEPGGSHEFLVFDCLQKAKDKAFLSEIKRFGWNVSRFENDNYPCHINEVNLSGHILMELGYIGKQIQEVKSFLLDMILIGSIKNDTPALREHVEKFYRR